MKHPDIVLVIGDLGPGGSQRVVTTLANAWNDAGRTVAIVTLSDSESDFFEPHEGIIRRAIGQTADSGSFFRGVCANFRRIVALRRTFKELRATNVVAFIGSTNVLTVIASLGLRTRVVISERNDPRRQPIGRAWRIMRRVFYPMADFVTANSEAAMGYLGGFIPSRKLVYVPNPVAYDSETSRAEIPETTILTVASFTYQKAHEVLLHAFAKIADSVPGWRLALIGEGEAESQLRALADSLGIGTRIDWLGTVSNPFPYYRAAGLFVLPSRFEGTANVVLEAMSCGMPVIVTERSAGPSQFVENGVSGLVVPVDDVSGLASALLELIHDPDCRRRLAAEGTSRAKACTVDRVLAVWNEIVSNTTSHKRFNAVR